MTPADRVEKFMDCAGGCWGRRREGLLDQLENFGGIRNVAAVMAATSPKEGSAAKVTA